MAFAADDQSSLERARLLHTSLCPIFQSFLWQSVLQYLAVLHPPHSLRVAGTPGSPGLLWQTAHSTRAGLPLWVPPADALPSLLADSLFLCRAARRASAFAATSAEHPLPPVPSGTTRGTGCLHSWQPLQLVLLRALTPSSATDTIFMTPWCPLQRTRLALAPPIQQAGCSICRSELLSCTQDRSTASLFHHPDNRPLPNVKGHTSCLTFCCSTCSKEIQNYGDSFVLALLEGVKQEDVMPGLQLTAACCQTPW
jgi:hypothetical protein